MGDDIKHLLRQAGALPDDALDLTEIALALASLDRKCSRDWYREHIARLTAEVGMVAAEREPDGVEGPAAALRTVFADRYGYHGDTATYEDPQNANLMRVIDRRKGLPVALGILYIHAARAQGWECAGLNFPGHFLIRLDRHGERAILDPFDGARPRAPAELRSLLKAVLGQDAELRHAHYAPVGNRAVLLRLQNNVKLRHLNGGRVAEAAAVLDGMLMFAPDEPDLWREAGLVKARLGEYGAAIEALDRFIAAADSDHARHEVATLLHEIKSRLN
jgi:regulator of sirC expression with transglutaminase-like and TPR domain